MADMSTPRKPYGNVTYADPGYQKDKQARYPIDTLEHAKAAWSYINQGSNASAYSPAQLAQIKDRIQAALKRFGVTVSDNDGDAGDQKNSAGPRDIDVVRAVALPQGFEESDAPDDGLGLMTGRFSALGEFYPVESKFEGRFIENVARGAFDQSIAENRGNMRVLFDHGFDPTIGNKVLGPIRSLNGDSEYEVPLFDTSYNRDLLPGLRSRVYGASMRMRVHEDSWNDQPSVSRFNPDGLPERTITRAEVMEFGPVTFPANPGATAAVRSATDHYYEQLRHRDAGRYEAAVRAVQRIVPDFTGASEARSPGRSEPPRGATTSNRQRLDDGALRLRGIIK